MFFDSHCHLTADALRPDFAGILERASAAGVTHLLNIGDSLASSRDAIKQCEQETIWMRAAAGLHPQNALQWKESTLAELREIATSPNVVAIGEIGLDWVYDETHTQYPGATRAVQHDVLHQQLNLARELDKPVIIHDRDADDEILAVLESVAGTRGVIHCWAGALEAAARALELGMHLGFTGLVTFKNADSIRDAVRLCPLDKLLIETDAPYLAPVPYRGKRNEPSYLPYTAQAIAEIKGLSVEAIAEITRDNALRLFGNR